MLDRNFYRRNGERIGTPIQETSLMYCSDDNTYTEVPITLRARACRMELAPIVEVHEESIDLFAELFS